MTEKITIDIVDDDGNVLKSVETEAMTMQELGAEISKQDAALAGQIPGVRLKDLMNGHNPEAFFQQVRYPRLWKAAAELHPNWRFEDGKWQTLVNGKWQSPSREDPDNPGEYIDQTDGVDLIAWLETIAPLVVHDIEQGLRDWIREHDVD
jgi:hypothetical protein